MRIKCKETAAIGIDFQERLVPAMNEKEQLVANSAKLFKGLRILGVPVFLTQQYTKGLGPTIEEIRNASGVIEHVEKIRFSAFREIKQKLQAPDSQPFVIIFGIESHICVLQTAIELKEEGYQPILVTDCISSRKKEDYDIALERAKQEHILLATYESILFELLEEAGSELCKKVQKVIK